jgi:hypothetical protein
MRQLVSEGRVTRPLFMKGDMGPRRRLFLYKNQLSHYLKFRKYMK